MIKRKEHKKTHRAKQTETPADQEDQRDKKVLLDKLQRVTADFSNYQKRMARNSGEIRMWAKAEMVKRTLNRINARMNKRARSIRELGRPWTTRDLLRGFIRTGG